MMRSTALESKWRESGLVECRWQIELRHKRLYKSRPDARRLLVPRKVRISGSNVPFSDAPLAARPLRRMVGRAVPTNLRRPHSRRGFGSQRNVQTAPYAHDVNAYPCDCNSWTPIPRALLALPPTALDSCGPCFQTLAAQALLDIPTIRDPTRSACLPLRDSARPNRRKRPQRPKRRHAYFVRSETVTLQYFFCDQTHQAPRNGGLDERHSMKRLPTSGRPTTFCHSHCCQ